MRQWGVWVCWGGRYPARRSLLQDSWLVSAASVCWDQAQGFLFPSPEQERRGTKCTTCLSIGVGSRTELGLFCLPASCCCRCQAGHCLWGGESTGYSGLSKTRDVFIYLSPASNGKDRMMSLCFSQGEIAMKLYHSVRLWKAVGQSGLLLLPKGFVTTLSGLMAQPRRSAQRSHLKAFPVGQHTLTSPGFVRGFSPLLSLGVWKFTGLSEEMRNDFHS